MSVILKFDFKKIKNKGEPLHFSEEKYLNYTHTKKHNFACDNYICPETRANKNKKWTHLGALNKEIQYTYYSEISERGHNCEKLPFLPKIRVKANYKTTF